jgi:hypothetical protein
MVLFKTDLPYSQPFKRPKARLPSGEYKFSEGKLKTTSLNQHGYLNQSITCDAKQIPTEEEYYLAQVGSLMYLHKSREICVQTQQLKEYLRSFEQDIFYSTESVLPGSYYTNMFHLLNPQHLNHVHKLTLTGVKFQGVSDYQNTQYGGKLSLNMKMYGDNIFTKLPSHLVDIPLIGEVIKLGKLIQRDNFQAQLRLLGPFEAELYSPIGTDYYVSIIFHLSPKSTNETTLFMDFCSNLPISKYIQKIVFAHIVPIVVLEDYFHLKDLSKLDDDLLSSNRKNKILKDTHFLRLHQRFLELYS